MEEEGREGEGGELIKRERRGRFNVRDENGGGGGGEGGMGGYKIT